MKDRRRYIRLLRHLRTTTVGCYESDLTAKFGESVHAELSALFIAGRVEFTMGEHRKWVLTSGGRGYAADVLGRQKKVAA